MLLCTMSAKPWPSLASPAGFLHRMHFGPVRGPSDGAAATGRVAAGAAAVAVLAAEGEAPLEEATMGEAVDPQRSSRRCRWMSLFWHKTLQYRTALHNPHRFKELLS